MSCLPRLRQSCRRGQLGPVDAVSAGAQVGQGPHAQPGHPPLEGATGVLQGHDPRLDVNRLFLSGVLAADPLGDVGRDGEPVTLLLVAFPAPDTPETRECPEAASCEVEVPEQAAGRKASELRAGATVLVTGQLSGGGGVIATEIHSGPALESATR
jgi:hypothetical protein